MSPRTPWGLLALDPCTGATASSEECVDANDANGRDDPTGVVELKNVQHNDVTSPAGQMPGFFQESNPPGSETAFIFARCKFFCFVHYLIARFRCVDGSVVCTTLMLKWWSARAMGEEMVGCRRPARRPKGPRCTSAAAESEGRSRSLKDQRRRLRRKIYVPRAPPPFACWERGLDVRTSSPSTVNPRQSGVPILLPLLIGVLSETLRLRLSQPRRVPRERGFRSYCRRTNKPFSLCSVHSVRESICRCSIEVRSKLPFVSATM
jgi:Fe-S-cluster containining protein